MCVVVCVFSPFRAFLGSFLALGAGRRATPFSVGLFVCVSVCVFSSFRAFLGSWRPREGGGAEANDSGRPPQHRVHSTPILQLPNRCVLGKKSNANLPFQQPLTDAVHNFGLLLLPDTNDISDADSHLFHGSGSSVSCSANVGLGWKSAADRLVELGHQRHARQRVGLEHISPHRC